MTPELCSRCGKQIRHVQGEVKKLTGGIYYHIDCWEKERAELSEEELAELESY